MLFSNDVVSKCYGELLSDDFWRAFPPTTREPQTAPWHAYKTHRTPLPATPHHACPSSRGAFSRTTFSVDFLPSYENHRPHSQTPIKRTAHPCPPHFASHARVLAAHPVGRPRARRGEAHGDEARARDARAQDL